MFPPGLEWVDTSSSNVARIAYEPNLQRCYVQFHSGAGGYYAGVPSEVWAGFLDSSSKGKFVYWHLRNGGKDDVYPWRPL